MSKSNFSFSLLKKNGAARLGKIHTIRGIIDTPTFMTVGTQATIKSVFIEDAIMAGAQIILSNIKNRRSIKRRNKSNFAQIWKIVNLT